jgi:fucose 4-O-acetylase-like acetyltransferase
MVPYSHLPYFVSRAPTYWFSDLVMTVWHGGPRTIAVECFLALSGYLFFRTYHPTWKGYRGKIARRLVSLLIPYAVWVTLGGIYEAYKAGRMDFGLVLDWVGITSMYPSIVSLWFIRDLFVLCLIAPAIYAVLRRAPIGLAFLGVLGVLQFVALPWYELAAPVLFWFSLGGYVAVHARDESLLVHQRPWRWFVVWGVGVMACQVVLVRTGLVHFGLDTLYALTGLPALWNLAGVLKPGRIFERLRPHTFFVFCTHGFINTLLSRLWDLWIPESGGWLALGYFVVGTSGIAVSVAIGALAMRSAPTLYGWITGGRGRPRSGKDSHSFGSVLPRQA